MPKRNKKAITLPSVDFSQPVSARLSILSICYKLLDIIRSQAQNQRVQCQQQVFTLKAK